LGTTAIADSAGVAEESARAAVFALGSDLLSGIAPASM